MFLPFDPIYLLIVGPTFLLALLAQLWVKSAFGRWSKRANSRGLTGAQAADAVLRSAGIRGVRIEPSQGFLSDHYDPSSTTLRLSPQNFSGRSIAAVAIAAHEAGHAIQHAHKYAPLELRSWAVPAASIGSGLAFPLFMIGLILRQPILAIAGIVLFSAVVAFQLITLPVEFDASRRAKKIVSDSGLITTAEEHKGVSAVLTAAAMTYVAATVQAIATLLYFILRSGLFGRNDE